MQKTNRDRADNLIITQDSATAIQGIAHEQRSIDPSAFAPPLDDFSDASSIHRLSNLAPTEAVTSPHLPRTILLLSSTDSSTRRLALTTLAALLSRLPGPTATITTNTLSNNNSTNSTTTKTPLTTTSTNTTATDTPQYHLLLGILLTTTSAYFASSPGNPSSASITPIPYFCTVYAALAATILSNPLHPLYDRVCRFHTRSPRWDIERLPSWWAHRLLYTAPSADVHAGGVVGGGGGGAGDKRAGGGAEAVFEVSSVLEMLEPMSRGPATATTPSTTLAALLSPGNSAAHHATHTHANAYATAHASTLTFLLTYLYSSLRTTQDLEILRKRGTLEPILALASARLPHGCYTLILALLWRCTCIAGGSTMLITRKGVVAWLGAKIAEAGVGVTKARAADVDAAKGVTEPSALAETKLSGPEGLKMLVRRLWDTCDRERVDKWSGGMMEGVVEGICG